jgi:ubiquinone/menaquinone biosynthesis C-methylase UbiE
MEYTQSNLSKLSETYLLFKQNITATKAQARRALNSFRQINDEFKLSNAHILELGAGSRGALLKLFDKSNDVVGIDKYLGALEQGYWKAIKTTTRKVMFDPLFYYYLKKLNGNYLNRDRKVLPMDAMEMSFPDGTFDFVYSRFFLEHIEDIRGLAQEIHRVLKPGGKTYHVFALYTTLDGAHTLDWRRYKPWEHLTGSVKGNAYINKYRLQFYKDVYTDVFGVNNVEIRTRIGDVSSQYLTPELHASLREYSEEELLTSSPIIVASKEPF